MPILINVKKVLKQQGRNAEWLVRNAGIGRGTALKLQNGLGINEGVRMDVLNRVCVALGCKPNDFIEWYEPGQEPEGETCA